MNVTKYRGPHWSVFSAKLRLLKVVHTIFRKYVDLMSRMIKTNHIIFEQNLAARSVRLEYAMDMSQLTLPGSMNTPV